MQKFMARKISRATNVTIMAEEQNVLQCGGQNQPQESEDLEISSVKMSGYLKKKRNRVGGWSKLYFVMQNSLLMSYNSREEYEKKLVSFKDVICLIPGNTILLPSLEPRFTIASNLNTFYTFRCDDNKTCSKWITAILECLARDIDLDGSGNRSSTPTRNFSSQQNLSHRPKPICSTNHSWETLPTPNWIVNHNGRILLELNYLNCNRAKLPIGSTTAKMLQKCTDNDVITTTKKVNFVQSDENQNFIRNLADHKELREAAHDKNCDQFRLHNEEVFNKRQSKEVNQISKMFARKSESQRPENLTHCNGSDFSEIGIEEQVQAMTFGDETGDYSSLFNGNAFQSIDSKQFNNKLSIEETYAEISDHTGDKAEEQKDSLKDSLLVEYATVDFNKKREARRKKSLNFCEASATNNSNRTPAIIYEDVGTDEKISNEDNNIYELIEIPLRPSRKSRSLVWKNWSRMHLFDFTKRFKDTDDSRKPPSPDTIKKRQKTSLTLSDFSKRFNYRSMRNKAKKMCSKNSSTIIRIESDPKPGKVVESETKCSEKKT